ncbi:hypothetical protein FRX31_020544 [Thalictrum thalictroides]|uniref:Uncharacterized protein n=1 Tax=Thalictrum thalictroides TaxID=46969 RepID=A0A7J6VYU6_THATH|nr:hypothetical protein FRX31_020544 [Thalictrum thalictroides]
MFSLHHEITDRDQMAKMKDIVELYEEESVAKTKEIDAKENKLTRLKDELARMGRKIDIFVFSLWKEAYSAAKVKYKLPDSPEDSSHDPRSPPQM